ncbi:hypothetical protein [Solidesulfovibrio sp.]
MRLLHCLLLAVCLLSPSLHPQAAEAQGDDLPLFVVPALATPPISRDSDGDGLPDLWELRGYTENGTFVNLPALGASPWHKDLFIWMDYMVKDGTSLAPSQTVIDNIKAVFANAPVNNPDGRTGITIHPVLKNQVSYQESLGVKDDDASVWQAFDALKNASFDAAYARSFRYMIWANAYAQDSSSGLARNIPSTDFIVSLGTFTPAGGTDWVRLGTFIHELGHCLSLRHGGADDTNYKPNYLSVMNYTFQMTGLFRNGQYGESGHPLYFDYQRMNTPVLNENSLTESLGLTGAGDVSTYGTTFWYYSGGTCQAQAVANANGAIDWNRNGAIESGVSYGLHCDEDEPADEKTTLTAQNNWANIDYSANGLLGPALSTARRLQRLQEPMPEELRHELNWETYQKLRSAMIAPVP